MTANPYWKALLVIWVTSLALAGIVGGISSANLEEVYDDGTVSVSASALAGQWWAYLFLVVGILFLAIWLTVSAVKYVAPVKTEADAVVADAV